MSNIIEVKIAEYSQTAAAMGDLRQKYEKVVFPVETTTGMKDALAGRKELRDIRVGLEKMRQEIKAPALERCRLIDAEAKSITSFILTLEDPIDQQIKAEEKRKEDIKREKERREAERVSAIREKIDAIKRIPFSMLNEPSSEIAAELAALREFEPGDEFAEFATEAKSAVEDVTAKLETMHADCLAKEQEAERLAAERAEIERLRKAQEERERLAREEQQTIEAKLRAEREAEAAKLAAERAELTRIRQEIEAERMREAERVEAERQKEAAIRAQTVIDSLASQALTIIDTAEASAELDDEVLTMEEATEPVVDFVHRTRIEWHQAHRNLAVEFALGPANIILTFDGKTGELKAAEVL